MWSPIQKDDHLCILTHKARKPYFVFFVKEIVVLKDGKFN